ncbi:MAG: hypothetical protein ACOC93_01630, partial [Planctomycetota bacterium]
PPEAAEARLARELRLIEKMGFSGYFLVVRDIVRFAHHCGAPVARRGSGASSIVAYVLGITNVCPIHYNIPFERFLHEGREDFPDLDIDFCWRLRDDVIDYAFRRWGRDHVAMVSMHTTFQPRSAFRETAKALGYSDEQISRLMTTGQPAQAVEDISRLCGRIAGLPHVLSVHPGGIVITPDRIDRHTPIQPAAKGVMVTQYDKDGVEDVHLVKLDLLGNRNLATVREACRHIADRHGRQIDIDALPGDDPAAIRMLQAADTVGCNQLESPAMRHLLAMMQPRDTRDVMQCLALIRPGAASVGGKETFIRRRRGLEQVPAPPPQLNGLLGDTYGIMLYEDDVMLVAAALMDSSLPEGDRFRKAVQKCDSDEQARAVSGEFVRRCRAAGVPDAFARETWVQMAKFNAYSFCRAHAASYARLSYTGAYLKAHYPLEFWTAALNNNQSMYHPRVYVEHAKRMGVAFRLPEVNHSGEQFTIDDGAIRIGLNCVAGLGPVSVTRILEERAKRPFEGLADFVQRTRTGEEELRSLIRCGAFDAFGRTRPTLMLELNLLEKFISGHLPGQPALLTAAPAVPNAPGDYTEIRKYLEELRVLGITPREHIMRILRPMVAKYVDADSRHLRRRIGRRVRLAGVVEARRTTPARNGGEVLFVTLADEYGLAEVTLLPDARRQTDLRFDRYGPYVVEGVVDEQYDSVSVTAERAWWCEVTDEDLLATASEEALI